MARIFNFFLVVLKSHSSFASKASKSSVISSNSPGQLGDKIYLYICRHWRPVGGRPCATRKAWDLRGSEDKFQELVLSFHYVGSGDRTKVFTTCGRYLYSLSRLASLSSFFPPHPALSFYLNKLHNLIGWNFWNIPSLPQGSLLSVFCHK